MKSLFFMHDNMSKQQLENAFLLCLAMLNFDHQVNLVFTAKSWQQIVADNAQKKQWMSLKLYGVSGYFQLSCNPCREADDRCEALELISPDTFDQLKNAMDFVS